MLGTFSFDAEDLPHDYHAQVSITWAELEDMGFIDWEEPEWEWDYYDEEQRERLQDKISARYEMREIGIMPPAVWRRQFIRKLNEVMPKYKIMYKKAASLGFDFFLNGDEHEKQRNVYSDFPATLLASENQDYASNASDLERETRREGDTLEKLLRIREKWDDIDVMILDDLEVMFSSLMTTSINGF